MSNIVQNAEGKFTFLFNNATIYCETQANCTLNQNCAGNFSFSAVWAVPNSCVCRFGAFGEACEKLTEFTIGTIAIEIIFSIVGLVFCVYALVLFSRTVEKGKALGTALQTTLIAASLGSFGIMLELSYEAWRQFSETMLLTVEERTTWAIWDQIAVMFSFIFGTIASLNVSLLWIEISERASKGKAKMVNNVHKYRKVLYVYYLTFGTVLPIMVFLGYTDYALMILAPSVVFITITYMYGGFKIRNLLMSGGDRNEDNIHHVSQAAIGVASSTFALALFAILNLAEVFTTTPLEDAGRLLIGLIFCAGQMSNIFVIMYCSQYTKRNKTSTMRSGDHNSSSAAPGAVSPGTAHTSGKDLQKPPTAVVISAE